MGNTSSELESSQKEVASVTEDATVDIKKWKILFEKSEAERKKLTEELSEEREKVRHAEKRVVELERDLKQSRLANQEKDEAMKEAKIEATRMSKKIESFEEEHESKGSHEGSCLSKSVEDNLRELAETELQCSVCSEVFMEATTINCGHTFCDYCIHKWTTQNSTCPMCRTEIKHMVPVKTLDQFVDKMYGQFVSEAGQAARTSLKEERLQLNEAVSEEEAYFRDRMQYLMQFRERRQAEVTDPQRLRDIDQILN